jgi:hypothetical protein
MCDNISKSQESKFKTDNVDNDDDYDEYDEYDYDETDMAEHTTIEFSVLDLLTQQLSEIEHNYEILEDEMQYYIKISINIASILEIPTITINHLNAWHLNLDIPITIKIKLNKTYFTDDCTPQILTISQIINGCEITSMLSYYLKHVIEISITNYFKKHNLFESFDFSLSNINKSIMIRRIFIVTGIDTNNRSLEYINNLIDNNISENDIITQIIENSDTILSNDSNYVDIWTDNIFKQIINLFMNKIATCWNHCVICDDIVENNSINMIHCDSDICNIIFVNNDFGFNIENVIIYEGLLLDFLLCMLYAYAKNLSCNIYLPVNVSVNQVDIETNENIVIDSFMNTGYEFNREKLCQVINMIPSINVMRTMISSINDVTTNNSIIEELDLINPLINPLIRWLYLTNISTIKFNGHDKNYAMWQFKTVFDNTTSTEEVKTIDEIDTFKTLFAYCSVSLSDVLPILFNGINNLTKKKKQNILFTNDIFSVRNRVMSQECWVNSVFENKIKLIFQCEIVGKACDYEQIQCRRSSYITDLATYLNVPNNAVTIHNIRIYASQSTNIYTLPVENILSSDSYRPQLTHTEYASTDEEYTSTDEEYASTMYQLFSKKKKNTNIKR